MKTFAAALVAVAVVSVPATAGGRGRARREERREEVQEKRDEAAEKREERSEKVDAKIDAKKKSADPGANRRQRRQGSRIVGGVKSGQLTQQEVDALSARAGNLRTLEANAKADGVLTDAERHSLHTELNGLSKDIRNEKTDADKTGALRVRDGIDGDKKTATSARRLAEVRRELNQPSLPPTQRTALEAEHASLVDSLFEERFDDDTL